MAALLLACVCGRALALHPWSTAHPEDFVEVLAGTDTPDGASPSNGNTLPQIKRPWGFNDWTPQTHSAGRPFWFVRGHSSFEGMRVTHQPSPWIQDYGYFLLQPHTSQRAGTLKYSSTDATFRPYLFNASLSDQDSGDDIGFELAPTNHAASVRVTFPPSAKTRRVSLTVNKGKISVRDGAIIGYTTDHEGGTPSGWAMYFVLKSSSSNTRSFTGSLGKSGTIEFAKNQANLSLATSFISVEQAELSLQREVGSKSFDDVVADGKAEWNAAMRGVHIEAVDETGLRVFYTNLWKAMLFPRYLTEEDASGSEVHYSPYTAKVMPGKLVADSGFWDSYRAVYALQSIAFADNYGALLDGWVNAYSEAGWLPQWPSPGQRGSMVGTMGDVVLADAIVKSKWGLVSGFDVDIAYEAIRKDAYAAPEGLFGRASLDQYLENGYVPESEFRDQHAREGESESVSRTMNYYVSDAALSRAAEALGHTVDQVNLFARSRRYGKLFNNVSSFFQPKSAAGAFYEPFDPLAWRWGFTEAGAWQYRFYVPHDVDGLQALYKGKLCETIAEMLTATAGDAFHVGGYAGVIHEQKEAKQCFDKGFGYYMHSNQPVHHVLWVAKKAGCNDLADRYLRKTMGELYTLAGWPGDEDNGSMGAWYVLAALGLYQLEGAADELVIGSPAIVSGALKLPNGKTLTVTTAKQAKENLYVHSATWTPTGGAERAIVKNLLKFTEVMAGGTLHFVLGAAPLQHSVYV